MAWRITTWWKRCIEGLRGGAGCFTLFHMILRIFIGRGVLFCLFAGVLFGCLLCLFVFLGCCVFPVKILHSFRVLFFRISSCWPTMSRTRSAMQEKKKAQTSALWMDFEPLRKPEFFVQHNSCFFRQWCLKKALNLQVTYCRTMQRILAGFSWIKDWNLSSSLYTIRHLHLCNETSCSACFNPHSSLGILFGSSLSSSHGSLLVFTTLWSTAPWIFCLSILVFPSSPFILYPLLSASTHLPVASLGILSGSLLGSSLAFSISFSHSSIYVSSSSSSSSMTLLLPMSWMVPAQNGLAHRGGTLLDPKWSIDFAMSTCLACASSCCQQLRCPGVAMRWSLRCRLWCQCRLCCSLQLSAICILAFSPPISQSTIFPRPPRSPSGQPGHTVRLVTLLVLFLSLVLSCQGEKKTG